MSARVDAATLLERALIASAGTARAPVIVNHARAMRWASATFVGARHRLTIEGVSGVDTDAWLDGLAEADLPLRGHLVADLTVIERSLVDGCSATKIRDSNSTARH